ncbi:class D beta-lactamase [Devosia ginsengisoli]|uniref:Class D beta-lactamase n=1 Tax=Devosia ginsengisoli TaxID=400770 RepID=A0A5B8LRK3_9HYPH|nr:class D beta-lactamase [Devosia ginsengisoli]QDZ09850.1 class D beta-lactamase [Devosia ginsengisoli]
MVHRLFHILPIIALGLTTGSAMAAEPVNCTVILDGHSGTTLVREGICDQRFAPFSTFKLPLAVIGYEAGILIDGETPRWEWHAGLTAPERDHKPVDPTMWERDSVLWYSREITRLLGSEAFGRYVAELGYGNGDVSGVPGKDNGLTHGWLGASLTISPDEQVAFIRRLLQGGLPFNTNAQAWAAAILPAFEAGDWSVSGKTGSGWVSDGQGLYYRDQPLGWFVGWAQRGEDVVVFARLRVDGKRTADNLGPVVREGFLAELPALLP